MNWAVLETSSFLKGVTYSVNLLPKDRKDCFKVALKKHSVREL